MRKATSRSFGSSPFPKANSSWASCQPDALGDGPDFFARWMKKSFGVGGAQLTAILLDTHVWAWSLIDDPHLSRRTREAFASADDIIVSAISFFEIAQKVRIGKWPEMTSYVDRLLPLAESQQAHADFA